MGQTQSINQLVKEKKEAQEFQKAFELLNTEQSMRQTLDCKKSKMYIHALNDECLPIVCAVHKFDEFLVIIPEYEGNLEGVIKNKLAKHLRSGYLEELTSLLTGVLRSVLLDSTEHEVQQTHVVYANKSALRIDYYLYFDKIEEGKKVLWYYIQVGVIDIAKARLPVLIYELTRATEDDRLKDASKELKKRAYDTVQLFDAVQTLAKAARGEKMPTTEQLPNPDDQDGNPDLVEDMNEP